MTCGTDAALYDQLSFQNSIIYVNCGLQVMMVSVCIQELKRRLKLYQLQFILVALNSTQQMNSDIMIIFTWKIIGLCFIFFLGYK